MFKNLKSLAFIGLVCVATGFGLKANPDTQIFADTKLTIYELTTAEKFKPTGRLIYVEDFLADAFKKVLEKSSFDFRGELDLGLFSQISSLIKSVPSAVGYSLSHAFIASVLLKFFDSFYKLGLMDAGLKPSNKKAMIIIGIIAGLIIINTLRMVANGFAHRGNSKARKQLSSLFKRPLEEKILELFELQENGYKITARSPILKSLIVQKALCANSPKATRENDHFKALYEIFRNKEFTRVVAQQLLSNLA